jgi:hypothetical protein
MTLLSKSAIRSPAPGIDGRKARYRVIGSITGEKSSGPASV